MKFFSFLMSLLMMSYVAAGNLNGPPDDGWESSPLNRPRNGENSYRKPPKKQSMQKDLFLIDIGPVYLRAYQGGTDFAQLINVSDITVSGDEPYGQNKTLDFDFDWGIRGGFGYQAKKSHQTARATYLYFATDADKSTSSDYHGDLATANQAVLSAVFGIPDSIGTLFTSAHSKWNLHFNMLDLTFGKKYPKRGCMSFEPFIGLKGMIFSETQKSTFVIEEGSVVSQLTAHLKQKIDFKGAGAVAGLNLDWALTKWISFIGSVDAALLYSSVETKRTSDNVISTILWIGSSNDVKGTPALDGTFALRGSYCWKNGRFIDLKIGYEGHYIFDTMKHSLFNADSSTNLGLMGWFATFGLGF